MVGRKRAPVKHGTDIAKPSLIDRNRLRTSAGFTNRVQAPEPSIQNGGQLA